ncbi:MAG TPA: tRNA uridine-5-carboxymethylaminomethyl(34) synthesis GTPase MnmE [Woeseiaceae bacterium]
MGDSPAYPDDTIVAAATPPGSGGIAVVRISGPLVVDVALTMLGRLPEPRVATFGNFRDAGGALLDQGIALYFPAPQSFTGEAVLELHGHGGPIVVSGLIETAIKLGARRAEPGEFSKRAYLNDKLDLVQAEAIADLIGSGTSQGARAALRSLSGAFSETVIDLAEQLTRLRMHVEAAIDFPEEDIDFLSDDTLMARLLGCESAFTSLRQRTAIGRVLRDGYRVVIAGRPNAAKSSLLNFLAGEETAIVTAVAGTTRDVLREVINLDGLMVEFVDTAGLRNDPDAIEAEGIRRARLALANADAVLWILDASASTADREIDEALPGGIPVIHVSNKIDLSGDPPGVRVGEPPQVAISAKTGAGVDALRTLICQLAGYRDLGEGAFTARQRHVDALDRAWQHFRSGQRALSEARAGELLAEELRLAGRELGTITGEVTSDDLLGRIFSEFCIGK